jgi:Fur family transcriptional regulator, ferric uptake regulator
MNSALKEKLLGILKAKNRRHTRLKKELISLFCTIEKPISALELNSILKKRGINVNKSTLYREMSSLEEDEIIKEVALKGRQSFYELVYREHHHHLICTECGSIADFHIENCLHEIIQQIQNTYNFVSKEHSLDIYGKCGACKLQKKIDIKS